MNSVAVPLVTFVSLFWVVLSDFPCEVWKSIPLEDTKTNLDGTITSEGITYNKDEIFSVTNKGVKEMRGCPCKRHPCVRKCCPHHQVYVSVNGTDDETICVERDLNLYHHLLFYSYHIGEEPERVIGNNVTFVSQELKNDCGMNAVMYNLEDDEYNLLDDGTLLKKTKNFELLSINKYCLDLYDDKLSVFVCSAYKSSGRRVRAESLVENDNNKLRLTLYPVCMLTSLPFLTATCLIFFFVPELNNLVGKSLSSLTLSSIAYTVLLSIVQLSSEIEPKYCVYAGKMDYFLFSRSFLRDFVCDLFT